MARVWKAAQSKLAVPGFEWESLLQWIRRKSDRVRFPTSTLGLHTHAHECMFLYIHLHLNIHIHKCKIHTQEKWKEIIMKPFTHSLQGNKLSAAQV